MCMIPSTDRPSGALPAAPRVAHAGQHIIVRFRGVVVAETRRALAVVDADERVVHYVPPGDVRMELLAPGHSMTTCPWKGRAPHYDIVVSEARGRDAAWSFLRPGVGYEVLRGHVAFDPAQVQEEICDVALVPSSGQAAHAGA